MRYIRQPDRGPVCPDQVLHDQFEAGLYEHPCGCERCLA